MIQKNNLLVFSNKKVIGRISRVSEELRKVMVVWLSWIPGEGEKSLSNIFPVSYWYYWDRDWYYSNKVDTYHTFWPIFIEVSLLF